MSGLLALNGALDGSPVTERRSDIVDVMDADADLGARVPYAWAALRRQGPEHVERVMLTPGEFEMVWAGQPVVVKTRQGRFGIAWVTEIEPDWEKQQRAILETAPPSPSTIRPRNAQPSTISAFLITASLSSPRPPPTTPGDYYRWRHGQPPNRSGAPRRRASPTVGAKSSVR